MDSKKTEISDGICSLASGLQKSRMPSSEFKHEHNSTPDQMAAEEDIIPETGWAWMVLIGCFLYWSDHTELLCASVGLYIRKRLSTDQVHSSSDSKVPFVIHSLPQPFIFLQEVWIFTLKEAFQYVILVRKIFLANPFVWQNNRRIVDWLWRHVKYSNIVAYATVR